jgi:uncharacterized protein (TIGR02284 family)
MTKRNTAAPAVDPADVASTLNGLLETLRDGENGFRSAAGAVNEPELKRLFLSLGGQRGEFAAELESELLRLGKDPTNHRHAPGLRRGWTNLKAAVNDKDESAVLSEVERAEDIAETTYREALQKGLPAVVQTVVERQFVQIQDAHAHICSLERVYGRG